MQKMTLMEREAREAPQILEKQIKENKSIILDICKHLKRNDIKFIITIGRGSSDHACTYAKYLFETKLGLVTSSAAPSVVTLYNSNLNVKNSLVIAISQSGKSPDICKMMQAVYKNGAKTIAMVNQLDSPLAKISEFVLPIEAGEEKAVAATKSYIASLTAIAQFVALFSENKKLYENIKKLPDRLSMATDCNWLPALELFQNIHSTLVIARGYGFPIAQEAALKFKETASIQAEAFSAAEVLHGPFALIKKNHPYLLFTQNDETLNNLLTLSSKIKSLGGKSILSLSKNNMSKAKNAASFILPLPKSLDPILDPIMTIQAFYIMVSRLAVSRGYNPDAPIHLKKITKTI